MREVRGLLFQRLFPEISSSICVDYTRFLNFSRPGSEDLCLFIKINET